MVNIPVPDRIERSKIVDLLRSWNIDPDDLLYLELTPSRIKAEVYARDDAGSRYTVKDVLGDRVIATHQVVIKIV